ncbi:MAG: Lrp/AsnC family transcriptional regulator [Methanoculleaceae archaeon]
MDESDRLILHLLEEDCRTPLSETAAMTGLSGDEVRERIRRMEESGVIRRYTALVDWEKAGDGEVSAIIELKVSPEREAGYDRIAEKIARFRNVRSVRLVTGIYDLHVLVTGKSMHEIATFVAEEIAPMDHIRETATIIIMKSYKENGILLVEPPEPDRLCYSF